MYGNICKRCGPWLLKCFGMMFSQWRVFHSFFFNKSKNGVREPEWKVTFKTTVARVPSLKMRLTSCRFLCSLEGPWERGWARCHAPLRHRQFVHQSGIALYTLFNFTILARQYFAGFIFAVLILGQIWKKCIKFRFKRCKSLSLLKFTDNWNKQKAYLKILFI